MKNTKTARLLFQGRWILLYFWHSNWHNFGYISGKVAKPHILESPQKSLKMCISNLYSLKKDLFPRPRPFAWPQALCLQALAPSLYLLASAPNLCLSALVPNWYLPDLAPNLYLPALTPSLYFQRWPPNLCLPVLPPIYVQRPWPEFFLPTLASNMCLPTLTENNFFIGPGL